MEYTLRFFPLQNAICFIILTCLVPVIFTIYIQDVLKLKKDSGSKMLTFPVLFPPLALFGPHVGNTNISTQIKYD